MQIAFFDFDGTITTKDTLLEFIKYSKGKPRFYLGFLLSSPWIIAYKLKILSNQKAKEQVLRFFFRSAPADTFQQSCDSFAADVLPGLLRPKALHEIDQLKKNGFAIVIVSASPENWIRKWTEQMGLGLLATKLGTTSASGVLKLTGNIKDANCHGQEKVRRINEAYTLTEYSDIYTYGDTPGDHLMLQLGTISFYKPFR
jgi:phosphatidylglycerophosphatase C